MCPFVDNCLPSCSFSFGHCVICPSSIYEFWLILWYLLLNLMSTFLFKLFLQLLQMEHKSFIYWIQKTMSFLNNCLSSLPFTTSNLQTFLSSIIIVVSIKYVILKLLTFSVRFVFTKFSFYQRKNYILKKTELLRLSEAVVLINKV